MEYRYNDVMAILKTQFKWTSINSTLDSKNSKTNPMIVSQSSITSDFKVQFTQEYKDVNKGLLEISVSM